jgi:hypothetical protein
VLRSYRVAHANEALVRSRPSFSYTTDARMGRALVADRGSRAIRGAIFELRLSFLANYIQTMLLACSEHKTVWRAMLRLALIGLVIAIN